MKFASLCCIAFCFVLHAGTPKYKLIAFENADYRDFSWEELSKKLGQDTKFYEYYKCNPQNQNNVFFPPPRINDLKNSLRVKIMNSDEILTYKKGKFYNQQNKRFKPKPENTFLLLAQAALKKIEKTKNGSYLLRQLEQSFFPITITLGRNSFASHVPEKRFGGIYMSQAIMILTRLRKADDILPFRTIGNGGEVNWNPGAKIESLEEDDVNRVAPLEVTLAHELYHAFDSIRGLLDPRFILPADNNKTSIDQKNFKVVALGESFANSTNVSEYRAVYFENLIRKELKLKYRKSYSQSGIEEIPMLDENNHPIFIPAACLNY